MAGTKLYEYEQAYCNWCLSAKVLPRFFELWSFRAHCLKYANFQSGESRGGGGSDVLVVIVGLKKQIALNSKYSSASNFR